MDYEHFQRATGMDIFDFGSDQAGFKFIIPHTAFCARDVMIEWRDHAWHLAYTEGGQLFTGSAEYLAAAYLALIADRCGFVAVVTPKPDDANST